MNAIPSVLCVLVLAAVPAAPVAAGNEGAAAGCGYVSTSGALPPQSHGLFLATVTSVNGRSVSPKFRHKVPAGHAVITVAERIDPDNFNRSQLRDRSAMQRREGKKAYKQLEIDVAPDTRYDLATKADINVGTDTSENTYWEPVVWAQSSETCR